MDFLELWGEDLSQLKGKINEKLKEGWTREGHMQVAFVPKETLYDALYCAYQQKPDVCKIFIQLMAKEG